MPNFFAKFTMFFKDNSFNGWSESHYANVTDYGTAQALLGNLVQIRLPVLPSTMSIVYARIGNDAPGTRDSLLYISGGLPANGTYIPNPSTTYSLPTNTGLRLRTEAGPFARGIKFIHGLTADNVSGNNWFPLGPMVGRLSAFIAFLTGNQFLLKVNDKQFGKSYQAITNIYPDYVQTRRVGRPFGQLRGRRRIR